MNNPKRPRVDPPPNNNVPEIDLTQDADDDTDENVWGGEEEEREFLLASQFLEIMRPSDIPPLSSGPGDNIHRTCSERLSELPDEPPPEKEELDLVKEQVFKLQSELEEVKYLYQGENKVLRNQLEEEKRRRRMEHIQKIQSRDAEIARLTKELDKSKTENKLKNDTDLKDSFKVSGSNKRSKSNADLDVSSSTSPSTAAFLNRTLNRAKQVQGKDAQIQVNPQVFEKPKTQEELELEEKNCTFETLKRSWEKFSCVFERASQNSRSALQDLVSVEGFRPKGITNRIVHRTFYFRTGVEKREERREKGIPFDLQPNYKWPTEFSTGTFHGEHDAILHDLLESTTPFHSLRYVRLFLQQKYLARFRGLDSLGIYEKSIFLSFCKLILWAHELWNLMPNFERNREVLPIHGKAYTRDLKEWTLCILGALSRNFLQEDVEVILYSQGLNIIESITRLGYFDHQVKSYLRLEKLILLMLEKPYHTTSENVLRICRIIGNLTGNQTIYRLLCRRDITKCLCGEFGVRIRRIFEDRGNGLSPMERVNIFLEFMKMIQSLKEASFDGESSIAKKWNGPVPEQNGEVMEEVIDDLDILKFGPPNEDLWIRIKSALAKTEEEEEEEKDRIELRETWDSNKMEEDSPEFYMLQRDIAQIIIPSGKTQEPPDVEDEDLPELPPEESIILTYSKGASQGLSQSQSQGNGIDSQKERKSWLNPAQWEDRKNTKGTCQCRKTFVSSTLSMILELVQIWEDDFKMRLKRDENLVKKVSDASNRRMSKSKPNFTDDIPSILLNVEEELERMRIQGIKERRALGSNSTSSVDQNPVVNGENDVGKQRIPNNLKNITNSLKLLKGYSEEVARPPTQNSEEPTIIGESDDEEEEEMFGDPPQMEEEEERIVRAIIEGVRFIEWINYESENFALATGSDGFFTLTKILTDLRKAFRKGLKIGEEFAMAVIDMDEEYNKD